MDDAVERFLYDLGGWPDEAVHRRRKERLDALIAEARAALLRELRQEVIWMASDPRIVYSDFLDRAAVLDAIDRRLT
ncbi:MAG: hypothetical protein MUE48_00250 [Desulfobacterales bacterium]|jgi:hypothetical protein|nr:hypothetical protein [Desulfobacterales bacterium]